MSYHETFWIAAAAAAPVIGLAHVVAVNQAASHMEEEPGSWRDLAQYVAAFFGVMANTFVLIWAMRSLRSDRDRGNLLQSQELLSLSMILLVMMPVLAIVVQTTRRMIRVRKTISERQNHAAPPSD